MNVTGALMDISKKGNNASYVPTAVLNVKTWIYDIHVRGGMFIYQVLIAAIYVETIALIATLRTPAPLAMKDTLT